MKIVFDTNVILSALLTQGLSSRVLDICIDLHEIVISPWIENDVYEKITGIFGISDDGFEKVKTFLHSNFSIIKPTGEIPVICRDKDDNNVLHLAKHIDAALIITGDKDLLDLNEYSGIKIVTPRQFMEKKFQG
jgi:uncharacterized protein